MRLIGSLKTQEDAHNFQKYCKTQNIEILLDKSSKNQNVKIQIWVVNEDDTEKTSSLLEEYLVDPKSPAFFVTEKILPNSVDYDTSKPRVVQKSARFPFFTWLWIFITIICFYAQQSQTTALANDKGPYIAEFELTPIEERLFFDVPSGLDKLINFLNEHEIKSKKDVDKLSREKQEDWKTLQKTSCFHGYMDMIGDYGYRQSYITQKMPILQKIKEGQLYRLITPVFLHGSLLHIIFNLLWIYILMSQIEIKLGIIKTFLVAIICGVFSNVAQYFISGPFFLGVSGIVVGLAGFIWMRQKKAPWEGYLLSKSVVFFLAMYVSALVVLSMGVFVFNLSADKSITFGIANTAHVIGGLTGLLCGRISFFRRC